MSSPCRAVMDAYRHCPLLSCRQQFGVGAGRVSRVRIEYLPPHLPDEADNHLIELALAGGAVGIVTHNVRDLRCGELIFDHLRLLTPSQCLEAYP